MKLSGDYHGEGYALLQGLITPATARELLGAVKASLDEVSPAVQDHMLDAAVLKRPTYAAYGPNHRVLSG
ncbi:MAG: hypothetical protein JSS00_03015, partial [Proteobacteria bacterium]|nr:hypothetical protein [Pseudomonadota bacterium]